MTTKFFPLVLSLTLPLALPAAPLTDATFSQVIKDVSIVSMETRASAKAKLGDAFKAPDVIRTGPDSLAELMAPDKTVTRVGANTAFSFEKSGRAINLEQGSVLFHSPKGKGGGTIRTKGASAAVLGTTIVVTATAGGGFKAVVLEGRGQITLPNGDFRILTAGQVTFVLPGTQRFGPQLNINLSKLVESSRLVQGFEQPLPSMPVILAAVDRQLTLLASGVATDTHLLVGNQATENTVETVDTSVLERVVETRADRLAIAKATDVVIRTPNLGDHPAHLFLDPGLVNLSAALGVPDSSGFVGKNIRVDASVSQLNFTPYLNQTDFTIGAQEYLHLDSPALQLSATLPAVGMPALERVTLAGKLGLTIVPGASITAFHIGELHLVTDGVMSLNSVSLANSGSQLHLTAGQNLSLTSVAISGFTTLNLNAAQNLVVASGSFTGVSSSPSIAANLSAGDTLTVNGTTLSSVAHISLSARTVNLSNINFPSGSRVNLYSQTGLLAASPNTGANSVPGHVNFLVNVNYGGSPAQLFVGNVANNITIGVRP